MLFTPLRGDSRPIRHFLSRHVANFSGLFYGHQPFAKSWVFSVFYLSIPYLLWSGMVGKEYFLESIFW